MCSSNLVLSRQALFFCPVLQLLLLLHVRDSLLNPLFGRLAFEVLTKPLQNKTMVVEIGSLSDCKQVVFRPDVERSSGECWRRHESFPHVIGGQQREIWPGFHHENLPVFSREINLTVGNHRRGAEPSANMREPFPVDLLASGEFVAVQNAFILQSIEGRQSASACKVHALTSARPQTHWNSGWGRV